MNDSSKGIALAISGGGYRSTLFALGSLWRLNEFGLLRCLNRITSVSGGSIVSAFLALKWKELDFDSNSGVAINFQTIIVDPIRNFCTKPLDVPAAILGFLCPAITMGDLVAAFYSWRLFGKATIQDIPDPGEGPEFIFYASSLQTGASVRITKYAISNYKVGELPNPELSLAKVVGASSAFPPFFSPVIIKCNPKKWVDTPEGAPLFNEDSFKREMILTDGGVYDNLGLEAVWDDEFETVFVCDAGAPWKNQSGVKQKLLWRIFVSQLFRVYNIASEQTRALRKRTLIDNYKDIDDQGKHRKYGGAYWGVASEIKKYWLSKPMVNDNKTTASLKDIGTRLNSFSSEKQGHLINWGYAMADTALRRWYFTKEVEPGKWPVPEFSLDIES